MDLGRLRAGEWIVAVSGAALLASLFLPWYEPEASGWEALSAGDVIIALVAAAALALSLITATQRVPAVPISFEAVMVLLGFVAAVLVLVRTIWLPGAAAERDWGLWLALAGALGIVAGSWIGIGDEGEGRPSPRSEVETIPAPRP